jgi:hypothetical protein
MVEGTRHIKRTATVTETFAAATPRMLKAAESRSNNGNGGELVPVGVLTSDKEAADQQPEMGRRAAGSSSSSITKTGNLKTRNKEVGFQVLAGTAHKFLPSLEAGAVGGVLAFAVPAPTACYEIYTAWKEGDQELARIKQERITGASTRVGSQLGIPGLKYALDLNGYYGGPARLPFLPLTAEAKAEVERLMADVRN